MYLLLFYFLLMFSCRACHSPARIQLPDHRKFITYTDTSKLKIIDHCFLFSFFSSSFFLSLVLYFFSLSQNHLVEVIPSSFLWHKLVKEQNKNDNAKHASASDVKNEPITNVLNVLNVG